MRLVRVFLGFNLYLSGRW